MKGYQAIVPVSVYPNVDFEGDSFTKKSILKMLKKYNKKK
jgi:hypothetical protein